MKKGLTLMITLLLLLPMVSVWAGGQQEGTATAEETETVAVPEVKLDYGKPSGDLEIFSWWAGDEAPALNALIDLYNDNYPQVEVINATVTGGSGVNAKAVLKTRMLGGDPPDSFQVHAGQELIGTWVAAERMLDLTPLFESEGWMDVIPEDLINLIGTENGIWSVPVNVHRSNVMWYIPENLEEWGVEAPQSWDEFLEIAEDLEAQGVTPLSLATNWTVNHLWESVALGVLGADKYDGLWNGELSWTSDEAVEVWATLDEVLEYTNDDFSSLSWQQATDLVVGGDAAFNIMGDWAAGYMSTTLNLEPGSDYSWAASPGTDGVFMFLADSFGFPKGVKNPAATLAWLKTCGSKKGQDTFNPLKGSISARTDSDLSKYNDYSQSAAEDFADNRIVGSLAHGVTANEGFMNDFATVMEMFLNNRNPEQAANAAQAIAIQNGIVSR
ncbi:MAG: extracellular solute-binding protein [Spirochaetaceae bacterium]|nr:extracellular solute-binding protein [Spirochaetaceae bacterium]MCF7949924.1 extracellular solute-binding protein [Spirochaetia bacterium]MCF7951656.1 extracellular solute-binding protein [Spirochaetaceae bacterium]